MPTNKQLEEKISILEACNNAKKLTIEKLKKENEKSYVKKLIGGMQKGGGGFNDWVMKNQQHKWGNCVIAYVVYLEQEVKNYEKLKKKNEELKENYQNFQDIMLDTDSSDDDELKEDLEDYKLFCDAFDVDCAREAIHNHWRNLPDECKEELTKKGLNPK